MNAIGGRVRGLGDEYKALDHQKLGKPQFAGGDEDGKNGKRPENEYERALREAGLLTGTPPDGYYKEWLENANRQAVPREVIVDIARRHHITPESFDVLNGMERSPTNRASPSS